MDIELLLRITSYGPYSSPILQPMACGFIKQENLTVDHMGNFVT